VQVHSDEGVANHIGPEPCVVVREDDGEASAGESIGQPLSRESCVSRVPTLSIRRKARQSNTLSQVYDWPGVVEDPGMCRRSLYGNREISSLAACNSTGPHREGEEP
jgi:hypothetical protein